MSMVELLNKIHLATSGTAIIVGGVSRWLNDYSQEYLRRWVDISIPSKYTNEISSLGRRGDIKGGTTWTHPVKEQFVVVTEDRYILDVFVVDEPTEYKIISGVNVITPQADLKYHQHMLNTIGSQLLKDKVRKLNSLYSD